MKKKVIIIGGGPAGMMAAIAAGKNGNEVMLLEQNIEVGKKLLITGNGRCNITNSASPREMLSHIYRNPKFLSHALQRFTNGDLLELLSSYGLKTKEEDNGRIFPISDKAEDVRNTLLTILKDVGVKIITGFQADSLIIEGDVCRGVRGTSKPGRDGKQKEIQEHLADAVILATGHSARDVYRYLASAKIDIEAKGIAVGVRLEHPSQLIDQIQYHNKSGRGKYLPAAEYSFVTQVDGRGVYSFCMCPGGFVIPAATGPEQLVVNGMSPSNRGTAWSNSGMVVETHPEDVAQFVKEHQSVIEQQEMKAQENASLFTPHSSLQMMYFQEIVEKQCWQQGNMKQTAPAQRMADFVNNRLSYDLPKSSYAPGLISSPLHFWMPSFVSKRLQEGFKTFGKNAHGFLTNEATLIAMETRTSSPVRIVRDRETLQHVRILGLFPCGEGAGYAGGIVSAGVDGERCAEMCAEYLKQQ